MTTEEAEKMIRAKNGNAADSATVTGPYRPGGGLSTGTEMPSVQAAYGEDGRAAASGAGMRGPASPASSLTTLCMAFFMVILDTTIVNVALPALGAGLHSTVTGLQWVVDGYTLVFASLLLAGGSACDRFGGRRVFVAGLAAFTAGSGLCAMAPGITLLVGARLLQGGGRRWCCRPRWR